MRGCAVLYRDTEQTAFYLVTDYKPNKIFLNAFELLDHEVHLLPIPFIALGISIHFLHVAVFSSGRSFI